ncbi:MarR family winged helix-turn-helix transcriptional regulator [Paraburkholderia flava]|uniref:MarR family winged helix-turn-helix transcriptional regulator n=1 Tax=Paraburkholderia flava TaxID=2547393 RepID=UPI00105D9C61|nr:MarR family transcriptional regulator [Paraburkholderia flava]
MNATRKKPVDLEHTVTELSLALGQLLRRLRQGSDTGGLSWSQTSALARLDKAGPMTTAELARIEMVKPQSMGATLADLEQEGLIERQSHPTDGRQVLFSLTEKGAEVRRRRSLAKHDWLIAAIAKLDPDEQRTLADAVALFKRLGEP